MKYNKKLFMPALLAVSTYLVSYSLPKVIVPIERCHFLQTSIDRIIPLYSPAFIIYILAFFQWLNAILVACKQKTNKGYELFSGFMIGSIIGFIIYVVYPTGVHRYDFETITIFDKLAKFVYSVDSEINACPSFHCFCSTVVLFVLKESENTQNKTLYINVIFSILVYISTLYTKQHSIIDIPCGIILACISMMLNNKINFNKLFEKINKVLNIN